MLLDLPGQANETHARREGDPGRGRRSWIGGANQISAIRGLNAHVRADRNTQSMLCPRTGFPHRLFWMRSAWWCHDCHQKIESCCEGAGCPSIVR
jgi:hypothetical protein